MTATPVPDWLTALPIAHRGLHDLSQGRAENSLGAFQAAVEHDYAIECDVQMSRGGEPVVFHDPLLGRMTGVQGNVRDYTASELANMRLANTEDRIAPLAHHLALVADAVPVVVELKGIEGEDEGFVEGVARTLAAYPGRAAVMSFDHWICAQFKTLMPKVPRGLTAEGGEEANAQHMAAMDDYDLQFVSYHVDALPHPFVSAIRERSIPVITWTVRTADQVERTSRHADQMTFEGFLPPLPCRGS